MAVSEIEKQLAPQADMSEVRQGSKSLMAKKSKKKGKKGEEEVTDGEKCKCDGRKSCSKCKKDTYTKRDSLTPREFLDACDLGIQDRSRTYIRARLDAKTTIAKGKKCGNSYIPRKSNCTTGSGGAAKPRLKDMTGYGRSKVEARNKFNRTRGSTKGIGNKLKLGAEVAAQAGSIASLVKAGYNFERGKYAQGAQSFFSAASLASAAQGSKASRMGNKGLASEFNRQAGQFAAAKVGLASLQLANKRRKTGQLPNMRNMKNNASNIAFEAEQRMKGFKKMKRDGNRGWLPDSVWAEGFSHGQ